MKPRKVTRAGFQAWGGRGRKTAARKRAAEGAFGLRAESCCRLVTAAAVSYRVRAASRRRDKLSDFSGERGGRASRDPGIRAGRIVRFWPRISKGRRLRHETKVWHVTSFTRGERNDE